MTLDTPDNEPQEKNQATARASEGLPVRQLAPASPPEAHSDSPHSDSPRSDSPRSDSPSGDAPPDESPLESGLGRPARRRWLVVNRWAGSGRFIAISLLLVLLIGAYFRFTGVNWDSNQHLHPDERFMTMVAEQISSVANVGEYFNTDESTLNPLGYGFYTYGMLPLFITRYMGEWFARTSYDQVVLVGRVLSGLFDLGAVLALFFLGRQLYGRWVGLLAAALYAAAVLPIQLSHYFAVDSFTTVFILLALMVAYKIMERPRWWLYALFGLLIGLAMTTKVSIAPLAGLVVLASLAYLVGNWPEGAQRRGLLIHLGLGLVASGLLAAVIFRIFQPYAFAGPGFFGLDLNPRWLEIIKEVRNQVAGRADFPPNHHWAGRGWAYGLTNMIQWGMGFPLGLAVLLGWAWATWRCLRGDWRRHLLLVVWVGGFFLYQNVNFWRYARYFQPIYPTAILLAAWALVTLVNRAWAAYRRRQRAGDARRWRTAAVLVTLLAWLVVASTFTYAYAFTRIYTRPHSRVAASDWLRNNLPGPVNVLVQTADGERQFPLSMPYDMTMDAGDVWVRAFTPETPGTLIGISTPHLTGLDESQPSVALEFALGKGDVNNGRIASHTEVVTLDPLSGPDGQAERFVFPATELQAGQEYALSMSVTQGSPVVLAGASLAAETSWDDFLPLRSEGFDPFGGIYRLLNLQLYEPDTEAKRQAMIEALDQAEYIVVSSNRVYDAVPRMPLRYPMSTAYYQALFSCDSADITSCAYPAVAPFSGDLGFDLVATFESYPSLGPVSFPDQTAQESFTVYDHPKVLIFKKADDFSVERVERVLDGVDLSQVVEQSAKQVTELPGALRLSPAQRIIQSTAGTWSSLFNSSSALNQSQFLGALSWYLLIALIGWLAFPLTYLAFRGLADGGYALARVIGLLFVAWLAWFGSSLRLFPFSQSALGLGLFLLGLVGAFIAWKLRREMVGFLRRHWRTIVFVEGLFLVLFLFQIILRWNNPDLWHPWRGGEKPGDMALFNAILKTAYFPAYDPWFAGQYVNYYYYGYVLSAVPTKLLGIVPYFAYNLLLPTWFAMTGLGVFSVAFNLISGRKHKETASPEPNAATPAALRNRLGRAAAFLTGRAPYVAGLAAVILAIVLGNLYQVRVLWNRLPEFAQERSADPTWLGHAGDALEGLGRVLSGQEELLRGDNGAWYFDASRAILNGQDSAPITEFPFFTFLYADLHPHLLDMPLMLVALAWIVAIVRRPAMVSPQLRRRNLLVMAATWLVAGLVFGALYPTNSWDYPVLLALGLAALAYAIWVDRPETRGMTAWRFFSRAGLLIVLSIALYRPFHQWFGTGGLSFELWQGPRTPLGDYLTVHGLFLFVILSYMVLESGRWLKPIFMRLVHTPLGEITSLLENILVATLALILILVLAVPWIRDNDYVTAAVALLLAAWAALLLLRPGQNHLQRLVMTLAGAGLGLTFIAELVTLKGDVGRMNVVFKFYLLAWFFFSVAAAAILVWIWPRVWASRRRLLWLVPLSLLVLAALTYPVIGSAAKAGDRWPDVADPPKTLDGMAFMLGEGSPGAEAGTAVYMENDFPLRLGLDYAAIRWMQENVPGTPTIVEGHTTEYRWGTRFADYTGLPNIVGWNWHLRQHNAVLPGTVVENRIQELNDFYNTASEDEARAFLDRYQADYIIVGDLERARYSADGLAKFERLVASGELRVVYPEDGLPGQVTIYQVVRPGVETAQLTGLLNDG